MNCPESGLDTATPYCCGSQHAARFAAAEALWNHGVHGGMPVNDQLKVPVLVYAGYMNCPESGLYTATLYCCGSQRAARSAAAEALWNHRVHAGMPVNDQLKVFARFSLGYSVISRLSVLPFLVQLQGM